MEIAFCDSFDDMMRRLQEQMQAADDRVQPWQSAIPPADYFLGWSSHGFAICGVVLNEDESRDSHVQHQQILSEAHFEEARYNGWNL